MNLIHVNRYLVEINVEGIFEDVRWDVWSENHVKIMNLAINVVNHHSFY